jgi:hypothetical protein
MVGEEAGKVVTNTVDALRSQPMMLVVPKSEDFVPPNKKA